MDTITCAHTQRQPAHPISLCSSAGYLGLASTDYCQGQKASLFGGHIPPPASDISWPRGPGAVWLPRKLRQCLETKAIRVCPVQSRDRRVFSSRDAREIGQRLRGSSKKCTDKTLKGRPWLEGGQGVGTSWKGNALSVSAGLLFGVLRSGGRSHHRSVGRSGA